MTDTAPVSPQGETLSRIAAANQTLFVVASRAAAASAQGMIAGQKRLMDFAARRLRHDFETAAALGRCARPADAMTLAQGFCQQALTDYADETTELMRVAAAAIAQNGEAPKA